MDVSLDNTGRYWNTTVKGGFISFVAGLFNMIEKIYNILYVLTFVCKCSPDYFHWPLNASLDCKFSELLSGLCLLRYFNSWIELSDDPAHSESSSALSSSPKSTPRTPDKMTNTLDITDNIERLAPQTVEDSVEWSQSYSAIINPGWDSEEEDEADVFGTSFM